MSKIGSNIGCSIERNIGNSVRSSIEIGSSVELAK